MHNWWRRYVKIWGLSLVNIVIGDHPFDILLNRSSPLKFIKISILRGWTLAYSRSWIKLQFIWWSWLSWRSLILHLVNHLRSIIYYTTLLISLEHLHQHNLHVLICLKCIHTTHLLIQPLQKLNSNDFAKSIGLGLMLIRVRNTPPVCVCALPQLMIFHINLNDFL